MEEQPKTIKLQYYTYIDISCFPFPQTVSGNAPFLHTRADNEHTFLENLQESHFYLFDNPGMVYDSNQHWWSSIAKLRRPGKHYNTSLCIEQLAGNLESKNDIRITDNTASTQRHPERARDRTTFSRANAVVLKFCLV